MNSDRDKSARRISTGRGACSGSPNRDNGPQAPVSQPATHGLFLLPDREGGEEAPNAPDSGERCPSCNTVLEIRERRLPFFSGVGERRLRAVQSCSTCRDTERSHHEARTLREQRSRLIESSGIPRQARELSLAPGVWSGLRADPMNEAALDLLRAWVNGEFSLYLQGPPGSGKTVLALAAAMDCLRSDRPQSVLFVRDQDFFQLARARWRDDSAEAGLERLGRIPVLVYDDLGRHHLTDYVREAMYDLLNERCSAVGAHRKTLFTGNIPPDDLPRWFDGGAHRHDIGAISSRFFGLMEENMITLLGGDRRRAAPEAEGL